MQEILFGLLQLFLLLLFGTRLLHHLHLVPEDEQTGSLSYHSLFCDIVDTLPPSNSWPASAIKDAIENLSFPMGLLQHSSKQKQPYRTAAASHLQVPVKT